MVQEGTDLYTAIENAMWCIFNGEIPLDDPRETIELFIGNINSELEKNEED